VDASGSVVAQATRPITTFQYEEDSRLYEQSAAQIWDAIAGCVREAVSAAHVEPEDVQGIGFDATCSLVVTARDGSPVSVTPPSLADRAGRQRTSERNVILWADHRAEEEAAQINSTGHKVLHYVGGTMSLEMETPKTLWLKRHLTPAEFDRAQFFDLPDYLTYRATDSTARSNCSLVCKYGYIPPGVDGSELGWQPDFLRQIGLGSVVGEDESFTPLGGVPGRNGLVLSAGMPVGAGLSERAAGELGLLPHTPVASALIDAYAGWVGTVAARDANNTASQSSLHDARTRLVAIAGTSTCYNVQSEEGIRVDGVWGPYKNTVFPGFWMNEGGQSSTGQLIDYVLETHPAFPALQAEARESNTSVFALLERTLHELMHAQNIPETSSSSYVYLVRHMSLYPDLYGNRSPLADTTLRGIISGLSLDRSRSDLARRYVLTLEAISLQTRHIVEEMNAKGHVINAIYLSGGGQARNRIFAQLLADTCGMRVQMPTEASASVVLGSALLGRLASEVTQAETGAPRAPAPVLPGQADVDRVGMQFENRLWHIMEESTRPGVSVRPTQDGGRIHALLNAKYKVRMIGV